jgi:16S rRNA (guanine966-N2)-methyltransferase
LPKARKPQDAGRGTRGSANGPRVLRIIGGRHRGRRVRFPAGVAIRPTPDRVRETLFNWLQPRIAGARVLDLFAGSGALGLEALSRGASQVTFVGREPDASVHVAEALQWLRSGPRYVTSNAVPYDIVFLDPPYDSPLLAEAARMLAQDGLLAADARIYLERPVREAMTALPAAWRELRSGRAGEVGYHLFAT